MNGMATAAQASAIGFAMTLAAILAVFVAISIVLYVRTHKDWRAGRLKKTLKNLVVGLGGLFLLIASFVYYQNASTRAKASDFHREASDSDGGLYTAKYAYLSRDRILLRLYRTSDMKLLAERTYSYPEAARLVWGKEVLIYDTSEDADGGGEIKLPPSLYDRLTAHLP
jgi:hypothetical protein